MIYLLLRWKLRKKFTYKDLKVFLITLTGSLILFSKVYGQTATIEVKDSLTNGIPNIPVNLISQDSILDSTILAHPLYTIEQLFQGGTEGAWTLQTSGAPASSTSVWIRATPSLVDFQQPLVLLNDMPLFYNSPLYDLGSNSPLSLINSLDIASITIIKDGTAARYGSRGANGIINIQTFTGKEGKSQISFHNNLGFRWPRKYLPMMNGSQYANFANQEYKLVSGGSDTLFSEAVIRQIGKGTNWQKELYQGAPIHQHHLSIRGGGTKTKYYAAAGYQFENGIVKGSDYRRGTLLATADHQIFARLSVQGLVGYGINLSHTIPKEGIHRILQYYPIADTKAISEFPEMNARTVNPSLYINENVGKDHSSYQLYSFSIDYRFSNSLFIKMDVAKFDNQVQHHVTYTDFYFDSAPLLTKVVALKKDWLLHPTLQYHHEWSKHQLSTSLGAYHQSTYLENEESKTSGPLLVSSLFYINTRTYQSPVIADLHYQYANRYSLSVSGRIDRDSTTYLHTTRRFYPSVAFGWKMTEESFAKNWQNWDQIHWRLSYGKFNHQVFPEVAITLPSTRGPFDETSERWNAGIDVLLGNIPLKFVTDIYTYQNQNVINVPYYSSTNKQVDQYYTFASQDRGVELAIEYHYNTKKLDWRSSLSVSRIANKVTETTNHETILYYPSSFTSVAIKEGNPIGSFYGYKTDGIWKNEPLDEFNSQSELGGLKYLDIGGINGVPDNKINYFDRVTLGNALPTFFGGFQNDFVFGPWAFNMDFYFSYGNEVLNLKKSNIQTGDYRYNQSASMVNRWSPENKDSDLPSKINPFIISDYLVEDGTFIRLQNIRLAYQFKDFVHTDKAMVYISLQNLLVWSRYSGYDPETSYYGTDAVSLGIDYDSYPRPSSVVTGFQLVF